MRYRLVPEAVCRVCGTDGRGRDFPLHEQVYLRMVRPDVQFTRCCDAPVAGVQLLHAWLLDRPRGAPFEEAYAVAVTVLEAAFGSALSVGT